jgi:2-amino-4-hydroxy-6-hydroxymethyldihydropteridine diphosphokinase
VRYWLGLGSNVGDRLAKLRAAVDALAAYGTVAARSRVFASSPVGGPPQPPFLNAALGLDSALAPLEMLAGCQAVETQLGRARAAETVRWGPRAIDVDVLLAGARGELVLSSPGLEVPHPRLHERAFALAPLCDLDATLLHPTVGRTLAAMLHAAARAHAVAPTGDSL